jgi:hypothetical protein
MRGGMVMFIYMLQTDTPKRRLVGTYAFFFFATNLIMAFILVIGSWVAWTA